MKRRFSLFQLSFSPAPASLDCGAVARIRRGPVGSQANEPARVFVAWRCRICLFAPGVIFIPLFLHDLRPWDPQVALAPIASVSLDRIESALPVGVRSVVPDDPGLMRTALEQRNSPIDLQLWPQLR